MKFYLTLQSLQIGLYKGKRVSPQRVIRGHAMIVSVRNKLEENVFGIPLALPIPAILYITSIYPNT